MKSYTQNYSYVTNNKFNDNSKCLSGFQKMILERKLEDIEDLKEIENYEKTKGLNPVVSWNDFLTI